MYTNLHPFTADIHIRSMINLICKSPLEPERRQDRAEDDRGSSEAGLGLCRRGRARCHRVGEGRERGKRE